MSNYERFSSLRKAGDYKLTTHNMDEMLSHMHSLNIYLAMYVTLNRLILKNSLHIE